MKMKNRATTSTCSWEATSVARWVWILGLFWLALSGAVVAQTEGDSNLIDDFSVKLAGRSSTLDTKIQVDSQIFGVGTIIDVERDLGLSDSEDGLGLGLDWRISRRNQVGLDWAVYKRSRSKSLEHDLQIGDFEYPVGIDLRTDIEIETITARYTYFFVDGPRTAFGAGLGIRWYSFDVVTGTDFLGLDQQAHVSGPVPFVGIDFRWSIAKKWRFLSNLGYFDIEIDDISGGQLLGTAAVEFLPIENLGVGLGFDLGQLDADLDGDRWKGSVDSDIQGLLLYVRGRW